MRFITPIKPRERKSAKPDSATADTRQREQRRLRKEFPFLGSPSCPLELKALVADRLTSFQKYHEHYPQLFLASTHEECADVAGKIVEAYIENRRVWEELKYYQQHGKILGHHPIFRQFSNVRRLRTMSLRDLLRREQQVKDNIWRVKSEMRKGDRPHLDETRRDKLRAYETEMAEIRRLLDEE